MKFDIVGRPFIRFTPSLGEVELLIKLSRLHKDVNRKAAGRADGFIGGWKGKLEFAHEWAKDHLATDVDFSVMVEINQLDVCTKILDVEAKLTEFEAETRDYLRDALRFALKTARAASIDWCIHTEWRS